MKMVRYNVWDHDPRPITFYKKIGNYGRQSKLNICNSLKSIIKNYNESVCTADKISMYHTKELIELCDQTIGWVSMGFINKYKHCTNVNEFNKRAKLYSNIMYLSEYMSDNKKPDLKYYTMILISSMILNGLAHYHANNEIKSIVIAHHIKFMLNNYREEFLTYFMTLCHTLYLWKNFLLEFTHGETSNGNNTIKLIEGEDYINYLKNIIKTQDYTPDFPINQKKIFEIFDEYSYGNTTWIKEKELTTLFNRDINFNKTDVQMLDFTLSLLRNGGIYFDSPVENIEYLLKEKVKEVINDGRQKQDKSIGKSN
nr:MAG TPA: hypothetical protein [Caudoviricetes sp.]